MEIKVKIAQNRQPWFGFTLMRGHAFCKYKNQCIVSGGVPHATREGWIYIYRQTREMGWIVDWIEADSALGAALLGALHNSPWNGVQIHTGHATDIYNPRLVTGEFTPMRGRIPGGGFGPTTSKYVDQDVTRIHSDRKWSKCRPTTGRVWTISE